MDSKSALQELKNFQSTRKSASAYQDEFSKSLGVNDTKARADDMRGVIRNTEASLKAIPDSVAGRTRGNLVTEAQRSRLVNLESQPISERLSGLQGSYSDEMASYRDLLAQANQKAGLAYQTDSDRLAALEGNYNKIFAAEQEAERKRQFEAQMALERENADKALKASMAAAASFNPSIGTNSRGSRAATDPVQQAAYDDVYSRVKSQSDNDLRSDFRATAISAGYGNQKDKYKVQLYLKLRPDLFRNITLTPSQMNISNASQLRF